MFYSNGAYSLFKVDTPVISGGATPPSFQDIYSYEFDGVDDYIDCGDNDNLSFGNTTNDFPFTFSVWVKVDNLTTSHTLIKKFDYYSGNSEYNIYIGSDGAIYNNIYSNGVGLNRRGRKTSIGLISINTWHHIVWTYDGQGGTNASNGIKIYLDGLRVDNANNQKNSYVAMRNSNLSFKIGEFINGNMDEVSVFNSELSASDITSIYNSGVPNNLNDLSTPPLSWWRMGESASWDGSNWTLTDQGSGGNNATTENMAEASRVLDVPPNPFANTKSILLDGIDDYVSLASRTQNFTNFSLSFWCIAGGGNYKAIVGSSVASDGGILYAIVQAGGYIKYRDTSTSWTSLTTPINNGNWHHVFITYDNSSNTLKGYTNGSLTATINPDYSAKSNKAHSFDRIGSYANSAFYNSNIDEIAIYDSVISIGDVWDGGGVPTNLASTNPIHWWRCGDGDTSPILTDNGSGGNDGTMANFTTFSTDVPT